MNEPIPSAISIEKSSKTIKRRKSARGAIRRPLPAIAREAVAIHAGTLWCQFGVINEQAAQIAENGGVTVIMDRCLKVEHARYVGRMHWLGFNTERITSVRSGLQ